jgi:uncharacterized protein YuzE
MKNKNDIKIKYDADADVLSWEISEKRGIDYASELGNIIVHFSKNNIPVLVEILEASKFLKKSEKTVEKARDLLPAHS